MAHLVGGLAALLSKHDVNLHGTEEGGGGWGQSRGHVRIERREEGGDAWGRGKCCLSDWVYS